MAITSGTATVAETATGTSLSGTLPSGLANNDVLVAHYAGSDTVANTTFSVSGWVAIKAPIEFTSSRLIASYYRVVTDAGTQTAPSASWVTGGRATWEIQRYIGVDQATPLDCAVTYDVQVQTLPLPSITTVTDGARAISGAAVDSAATGTLSKPTEMTLVADSTGSGRRAQIADEVRATAGATGTRTWSHSTSLIVAGWLTALRPVSSTDATVIPPARVDVLIQ